jgi:hypothetical protein
MTPEDGFGFGHNRSYFPDHEGKMGFGFKGSQDQNFPKTKKEKESKVS